MQDTDFLTLQKKKQSMLFSMLLWFIPIISINIGFCFIKQIDYAEFSKKQEQAINTELKSMAYTSDSDFQLSMLCNKFNTKIKALIEDEKYKDYSLDKHLKDIATDIFNYDIPDFELYVFELNHKKNKVFLKYSKTEDKNIKKYQLCSTFQHLVYKNIEKQNNFLTEKKSNDTGSKILSNFLNSPFNIDTIAENLKGKLTYALYKYEPYRFIWNYHKAINNNIYGYYILYKNDINIEEFAKKKVLAESNKTDPLIHGAARAFIPVYKGYGKTVYQNDNLKNNKLFNDWILEITPKDENGLKKFLLNTKQITKQIGNYTIYSYLGQGKTHLSVLLIPVPKKPKLPEWLTCLNIVYLGILSLILIRGILNGFWPTIYLKARFTMNYILAAFLPASLLIITSYGYLLQNAESEKLQQINKLQNCINEFDQRKEQLHDSYRNIINETVVNPNLISLLKQDKITEAKNLIVKIFSNFRYPFKSVYFLSKSECYSIISEIEPKTNTKKFVFDKKDEALEKIIPPLRRNMQDDETNDKLDFSHAEMAYNLVSDKDTPSSKINSEFARALWIRRGDLLTSKTNDGNTEVLCNNFICLNKKKENNKINTQIQDFCIAMHAVDEETDNESYRQTNDYLKLLYRSDFVFISFKQNDSGLEIFEGKDDFKLKNIKTDVLRNLANKLALKAFLQNSQVSYEHNKIYLTAIPSQKYNNLVIVAACSLSDIEKKLFIKKVIFILILISSAFIIVFCVKFSSNKILKPITILKSALDKVSKGQLNITIKNENNDELGSLCNNFSDMAQGLREKQTLSSLISDQALQAIEKGSLEAEEFNGVALVSDIRNFTGTCETYSPNLITKLLNKHFAEMTKIILFNGGKIYKYIGDAIEAVFPEDKKYEKPAYERAFCSAIQMLLKLDEINKERSTNKEFTYRIGIGLQFGKMYSGPVGSIDTRLDYSILGDPLKEAAKLEGLSKNKPDFPLVVDEYIKNKLNLNGILFDKLSNTSSIAYLINNESINFIINKYKQSLKINNNDIKNYNNEIQTINVDMKDRFINKHTYLISVLFVITLTLIILLSYGYLLNAKYYYKKVLAETNNSRLLSQIQNSDSSRQSFENICRNIMEHCEILIKQNATLYDIEKYFYNAMKENECEYYILGLGSDTYAHFSYFNPNFKNNDIKKENKCDHNILSMKNGTYIYSNKFTEEEVKNLQNYRNYNFLNKERNIRIPTDIFARNYFNTTYVGRNLHARASATNILKDTKQSYLFCSCLNIPNAINKYNNYIIISKPVNKCFNLKQIANGFSDKLNNTEIAIGKTNDKNNQTLWITSKNFDKNLLDSNNIYKHLNYKIKIASYSFNDYKLGQNDYKLILAQKISNGQITKYICVCLILLTFIAIILISKKIKNILNTKITFKLWLSIIGSSIIPILALILIFELYIVEETNLIKQRKFNEIKTFAREFEYKANFWHPYGWQKIKEFSKSKQTQEKINDYSDTLLKTNKLNNSKADKVLSDHFIAKTPAIKKTIKEQEIELKYLNDEIENLDRIVGFAPEEVVISTPKWDISCLSVIRKENRPKISMIFIELCNRLIKMTSNNKGGNLKEEVKGEFIDDGLKTLHTFFGPEFYIKVTHAINTPITIAAGDNLIGVIHCIIPGLKKPFYDIFWMIWFNRSLEKIANEYNQILLNKDTNDKFEIYPFHSVHYGYTRFNDDLGNRFWPIQRITSYVSKSKIPIFGEYSDEKGSYLYDARICYDIPNFITVTLANTINEEKWINNLSISFYASILFIIFIIILMTNNIANDILVPINMLVNGMEHVNNEDYDYRLNYERFDELGILCSSFDQMTKSLAEKQLIGKMLSTTAQKESINESFMGSKKADCVLVYASVKNFANYMHNLPPIILLNKLRKHVEYVASAVISEGGEIDKIMGEKQLIAFHTNSSKDIKACIKSACKAALKINNLERNNELPFPTAIGISVGTVITGFLGVGEKRDFTVIGDPVNVSARISAYAEQNDYKQVLVSEIVYEKSKDTFEGELIGEIPLKGKSEPMKVYHLIKDIRIQS